MMKFTVPLFSSCVRFPTIIPPSQVNEHAFNHAVEDVTAVAQKLLDSLVTHAEPKGREEEAAKTHERTVKRFGNV